MMITTNGSFAGNLDEDIDMRLHTNPDLDYIMAFFVTQGLLGASTVPGMTIQLAASEQRYLVNREGEITLVNEGPDLITLLDRDLQIKIDSRLWK